MSKRLVWRGVHIARRALGLIAISAWLGGCGGGGSNDTPATAPSVRLSNVRVPPVQQEMYESVGNVVGSVTLTADLTGDLATLNGKTVHVLVEDPDHLLSGADMVQPLTPTTNALVLRGAQDPKAGRYVNSFRVRVCLDVGCQQEFGGSPISVPYDIVVLSGVIINGGQSISLSGKAGTSAQAFIPVTAPTGTMQIDMQGHPWFEASATSFETNAQVAMMFDGALGVQLSVNAPVPGRYVFNLDVTAQVISPSGEAARIRTEVPVTYDALP